MNIDFVAELIEQIPDAVIVIWLDGRIFFWNKGAEAVFGYTSEEAMGSFVQELLIPIDQIKSTKKAIEQTIENGSFIYEAIRRKKDNSIVYVDISKKLVRDTQGNPSYIVITKKDITHLKVLRDAKIVEAKFQSLLESTPDAIVMINNTGRIVLVNSQAEQLFDYPKGELIGKPIEILLPDRFRHNHLNYRTNYFDEPKSRRMGAGLELYGKRRDGTEFPVEISLSPLETEEGFLAMSAIRDITDRKNAEAKFRGLLEFAPDAMVIVNPTGQIVLVNAQTEKLFLYKREELLNKPIEILLPEQLHKSHIKYRNDYFAQPNTRPMGAGRDLAGRRKDGTEFPAEISLSPLETKEGILVMAAIRDITERKLLEEIRRKTEEEQHRRIQEANRLKSEFLANMSHELRTPLNGIIGFSEFLYDEKPGVLNDKQREYLNDILTSGRHLLQLINDILDLAKIESGKITLSLDIFFPKEVIEEVFSVLKPVAKKKNITIDIDISSEIGLVELDPQKFKQVLYNLLSNAIKFTDDNGQVKITLYPQNDNYMQLQIIDNGIGIRKEDFGKLFVEFQQLDSSSSRSYQGTGLGLALTKKLVELQKGMIRVESNINTGSVFSVLLPLVRKGKSF